MATVAEVIKVLQELPQDAIVVMSADGEGNEYSPFADVAVGGYWADTTWSGEFTSYADELHDEHVPAVCLWPVN